jgi:hypothetical protein
MCQQRESHSVAVGDPHIPLHQTEHLCILPEIVQKMTFSCSVNSSADTFNVLRVGNQFPNNPLACVGFASLFDVSKELGLKIDRLENFCAAVDASMPNENSYHNKLHVADVTQMMFRLTREGGETTSSSDAIRICCCCAAVLIQIYLDE